MSRPCGKMEHVCKCLAFIWVISSTALAQNYHLKLRYHDLPPNETVPQMDSAVLNFVDQANSVLSYWHKRDYLTAFYKLDSLDSHQVNCTMFLGRKLDFLTLKKVTIPEFWPELDVSNLSIDKPLTSSEVREVKSQLLKYGVENGYPFTTIKTTQLATTQKGFSAELNAVPGPLFKMGGISFQSDVNISIKFMEAFLGIREGALYDHEKIENIGSKILTLAYTELIETPKLFFKRDGTVDVVLNLKMKSISAANGIVGIAQSESPDDPPLITGEIDLKLRNLFGRGVSLDFDFERFKPESQSLTLASRIPYLFSAPIEIVPNFSLTKFDTTFFSVSGRVSLGYLFSSRKKIAAFHQREQIIIRGSDAGANSNLNQIYYGLSAHFNFQDRLFNPQRGLLLKSELALGQKNVVSDEVSAVNSNVKGDVTVQHVMKLPWRFRAVYTLSGGGILDTSFVRSQSIWLGGFNSIRGFNQRSIPTQLHLLGSTEFRLSLTDESYAMFFVDGLRYWIQIEGQAPRMAYGYGIGYSFVVGAGVFEISYAIGNASNSTVSITSGVVSFGIASYF